jgi:accessory gene regulator protein AgrB
MKKVFFVLTLLFGTFLIWASVQEQFVIFRFSDSKALYAVDLLFCTLVSIFFPFLYWFLRQDPKRNVIKLLRFAICLFAILFVMNLLLGEDSGTR